MIRKRERGKKKKKEKENEKKRDELGLRTCDKKVGLRLGWRSEGCTRSQRQADGKMINQDYVCMKRKKGISIHNNCQFLEMKVLL